MKLIRAVVLTACCLPFVAISNAAAFQDDPLKEAQEEYLRIRKDADLELIKAYDARIRQLNRAGKRDEAAALRREKEAWVEHEKRELARFPQVIPDDPIRTQSTDADQSPETEFAEQYTAFCIRCEELFAQSAVDRAVRQSQSAASGLTRRFRNSAVLHARVSRVRIDDDQQLIVSISELLGFDESDRINHSGTSELKVAIDPDIEGSLDVDSILVIRGTPVAYAAKDPADFQYLIRDGEVDERQLIDMATGDGVHIKLYFRDATMINVIED